MDLVELIKTELNFLNLVDKKDIQNHIYHRIGEIFEYNPYWKFASVLEQYKIAKRKIDVHNVTDFYAVCFELAPMAVELFQEFGIEAREDGNAGHAYVVTKIEDQEYKFDLTKDFEDFMRIKFGLEIHYSYDSPSHNDNRKYKNTEVSLHRIKQKLQQQMIKMDKDEYVFSVFQTIEKILAFFEPENVGIVSGVEFINYLLKFFIGENYLPCNTRFYDKQSDTMVELYSLIVKGKMRYFVYKKDTERFQLLETMEPYVKSITQNYRPDKKENLFFLNAQSNYLKYKNLDDQVRKTRKELKSIASNLNIEEYIYTVFKAIENILPTYSSSEYDIESGVKCIQYLLGIFIGDNFVPCHNRFFDKKNKCFSEIFYIKVNNVLHSFVYQKQKDKYIFVENSNNIEINFIPNREMDLTLTKKQTIYYRNKIL